MALASRMADLVEPWWDEESRRPDLGHRALMRLIATAVALHIVRPGERSETRLATAVDLLDRLIALQGEDGLFSSDGNLHSPPDSAFTLNDVGIALQLLPSAGVPEVIEAGLRTIASAAIPALVAGGVHTPNHRWEATAALVRLREFDDRAIARAEQWLAEGIDVDNDGIYSERSANYAAFVSNPCLLALAEALERPDLAEIVHRNLHTELDLADADGVVETVFSRRQDQGGTIPLQAFHTQLRRFAQRGCHVCAAGAVRAEPTDGALAAIALLEIVSEPALDGEVTCASGAQPVRRHLAGVGLLVAQDGATRSVVYGGSDVPHVGRIGSGLAGNPTFLRYRSGAAVIRSLRLSRVFFGLGPFRAESLAVDDDGVARLHESVAARYYQPLPEASRRSSGDYRLADDGRFSASMAFDEREHDEVRLSTDVTVRPLEPGLEIAIEIAGDTAEWALEIALGEGELSGAERVADDVYRMSGKRAELRNGGDAVVIETSLEPGTVRPFYAPGEAFEFLGGSDALDGPRLYLTGTAPSAWTLRLT